MKWYLDTEFDENGLTIKLISIGLVNEVGEEFYAIASDGWCEEDCDDWVKANVIPKLPPRDHTDVWMTRAEIADRILKMIRTDPYPELWAYFSAYDWVVFCQLWGKMVDLPKGLPRYCMDLKQHLIVAGVTRAELPQQADGSVHDALADAKWVRDAHLIFGDR